MENFLNKMRSKIVLLHIFIAICLYNFIAFGFIQIDTWGVTPIDSFIIIIGAFGLGFQCKYIWSTK